MARVQIQDRTTEFRSILAQASKRQQSRLSSQRQSLLSDSQRNSTPKQRSDFSRKASEISRQIAATTAKLGRLAELAGRKTLFDDRSVEINELTFVVSSRVESYTYSKRSPC